MCIYIYTYIHTCIPFYIYIYIYICEDFVDLIANDKGDRKRSEKRRATGAFEAIVI